MRSKLFSTVYLMNLASALYADCGYCPDQVVLSEALAKCYLQRIDAERKLAESSGLPVHLVNLSDCLEERADRGPGEMPDPRDLKTVALDASFLIEPEKMSCLAESIAREDFDPETIVAFEVRDEECTD